MSSQEDDALRLRSLLESAANSPGDVLAACQAVDSVSRQFPRLFFRVCFSVLLRRIFGFEDLLAPGAAATSGGWISVVSQPGNESVAGVLIALLAPSGVFFRSLLALDNENAVRYVFPFERLPEWIRRLLAVERGALVLEHVSPIFKNKLKEDVSGNLQIELGVFEYYIFWFAYYAVCKQRAVKKFAAPPPVSRSSQFRTQIEHWASALPGLHHSLQQGTLVSPLHPYLQLLQLYLSHFVGPAVIRREREGLSLWLDDYLSHADLLVRTLIDFWLIHDDPCPFSLAICHSLQLHTVAPAAVYVPPGRELAERIKLMINYFSALLQTQLGNHDQLFASPDSAVGFRWKAALLSDTRSSPPSALSAISPYFQSLQRPLYRFCLRAFCFWPVGAPVTKIGPILDLWLQYLEPWSAILLVPKENNVQPGTKVIVDEMKRHYSGYWQGYVLSNYAFYTSMVSHFLAFALKFLLVDMEFIFQATCKVLNVLSKSGELLDLLLMVDTAYAEHFMGRHHSAFGDRIPAIQEQLQEWEDGVTRPEQEHGEMLRSNLEIRNPHLHFFAPGEYGGHHVLQSMILQAEAEIQASCSDKLPMSPKTLEAAKRLVKKVFKQDIPERQLPLRTDSGTPLQAAPEVSEADEAPRSASAGLQRHTWAEVKYKGDWMRRPIESGEIGWLVRILVKASDRINEELGFAGDEQVAAAGAAAAETRANAAIDEVFPEVLKPVMKGFLAVLRFILRELRRRGVRVNLRPFAHKQVIGSVVLMLVLYWISVKLARLAGGVILGR